MDIPYIQNIKTQFMENISRYQATFQQLFFHSSLFRTKKSNKLILILHFIIKSFALVSEIEKIKESTRSSIFLKFVFKKEK